jgi:hypothetical protein
LHFPRVENRYLAPLGFELGLVAGQDCGKALGFGIGLFDLLPGAEGGREQRALTRGLEPSALDIGLGPSDGALRFGDLRVLRRLSRLEVSDSGFGAEKVRFGLRHPGPIVVILDFDQQIALLDALEVVDRDAVHITLDLGAERRDIAANIGVVRDLPDRQADPAVPLGRKQDEDDTGGNSPGASCAYAITPSAAAR